MSNVWDFWKYVFDNFWFDEDRLGFWFCIDCFIYSCMFCLKVWVKLGLEMSVLIVIIMLYRVKKWCWFLFFLEDVFMFYIWFLYLVVKVIGLSIGWRWWRLFINWWIYFCFNFCWIVWREVLGVFIVLGLSWGMDEEFCLLFVVDFIGVFVDLIFSW